MNKKNIENIYPLSPTQEGILFHSLYSPNSGVYIVQIRCFLEGNLNLSAFEQAWQYILQQHGVLRTGFYWEKRDQPFQVVYRQVELPLQTLDWRNISPTEQQSKIAAFFTQDSSQGFNLKQPPLMRLTLIRLSEETYQFVWTKHHLLLDGWSTALVLQQVLETYTALSQNTSLPAISARSYGEYIAWLGQQDLNAAETFWRNYLQGLDTPTTLGIEQAVTSDSYRKNEEKRLQLSVTVTEKLKAIATEHSLTLNTLIQGAWAILLSRYSGESDVVFGATVSGRPMNLKGVETMVGLFINTLPVRATLPKETSLISWLQALQSQQLEMRQYEYSPLVKVQSWSEFPFGTSLFNSIVVFENYPVNPEVASRSQALGVRQVESIEPTNYPLTLLIGGQKQLSLRLLYDGDRFSSNSIVRLLGHLQTLLEEFTKHPQQAIENFSLLTHAEKQQILLDWNQTEKHFPNCCLHQLIEAQVEKTPNAVAVVYDNLGVETLHATSLQYGKLNAKANQLARYLQSLGVQSNDLIGVCLDRSPEMIIALLAIMKVGAAYIPLDPSYPAERLAFMLENAQVPVLLTQSNLLFQLPSHQAKVICLDTEETKINTQTSGNLICSNTSESRVYTLYTSGSTGKPKGVQIQHKALVNFLWSMKDQLEITSSDTFVAVTSLSFDIAALELFLPLITGSRLVIASRKTATDGFKLSELLATSQATVMQGTPATWRLLINSNWQGQPNLKMLCGGEALTLDLAKTLLSKGSTLWNLYGPTETTIWSTACQIFPEDTRISIGKAIANTQAYILNDSLQPVPIGVIGELYIGGVGLSQGYLNRPELTAEKFIPNPFFTPNSQGQFSKLYRTGDLARYLEDGNIECLGRVDSQVKIRGFRIELGEIETLLNQHPEIQQSVVIAHTDSLGDKRLFAYIIPVSDISNQELQTYLSEQLPGYMIPSAFVRLEFLPLTPNGKVDRKALPIPDATQLASESSFIAPQTEVEQVLAEIWSEVLGIAQISIDDNFFALGGHSLRAMQLVSRLRQMFEIELPLPTLFENPTIAQLAQVIESILLAEIDSLSEEEAQNLVNS
ncbi:MAG: amino acid adenylation domain-containing protein [Chroococcales cyanobacterium]